MTFLCACISVCRLPLISTVITHHFQYPRPNYDTTLNTNTIPSPSPTPTSTISNFARIHFSVNHGYTKLHNNSSSRSTPSYIRTNGEAHRLASIKAKAIVAVQRLDEQDLPSAGYRTYIKTTKGHDDAVAQRIEESKEKSGSAFVIAFGARKKKSHREIVKKAAKKASRLVERKLEVAAAERKRECRNELPLSAFSFF
jgi:hypothetical protein